ncbi:hypothetical protein JCM8547_000605 [Rhodosporidiobolus lusitaniae]
MSTFPPAQPPLWAQPLSTRKAPLPFLKASVFVVLFNAGILLVFGLLVLLLPLRIVRRTRPLYVRFGKGAFGTLLVLVGEWFAPTEMVVSAGEGVDASKIVELDEAGEVRKLNLPSRGIWTPNHSTLIDWLYVWIFAYSSGHHDALYIALKSSLRRIPIIGWSAQLFNFVFLDRKWETDRANFQHQLARLARTTVDGGEGEKAALLLFPEGTIETENTRGISSKFAEKTGQKDFEYLLLPRSTGLFFSLRQLALHFPTLSLVDLTLGYPVPRQPPSSSSSSSTPQLASDYYDIPSVLLFSTPPPELHIHIRVFPLSSIPLGDLKALKEDPDRDCTEEERKEFEGWLRERWEEKDGLLERFRREGSFVRAEEKEEGKEKQGAGEESDEEDDEDGRRKGEYVWRPHLRQAWWETLYAFSFFLPVAVGLLLWTYRSTLVGLVGLAAGGVRGEVKEKTCGCAKLAAQRAVGTLQAAAVAAGRVGGEF